MAGNKTTQTTASADAYLAAIADPVRRADCEALAGLMRKATNEPPKMWGPAIVGFGSYHYVYDSGREGDMCVVGFSSRKADITVYLQGLREGQDALLAGLGKHRPTAAACTSSGWATWTPACSRRSWRTPWRT